jgi:hypothetical protein
VSVLAYVFWHAPAHGVELEEYEDGLAAFHAALARWPPDGFGGSASFRLARASWRPVGSGYEDWYLVRGWTALGALSRGAVSGAVAVPHDHVAARSGQGAGGLYSLRSGVPALGRARGASWFAKPAGMASADLDSLLSAITSAPALALWRRQLVLGPAPEFCLAGPASAELPDSLSAEQTARAPIWPPAP